MLRLNASYFQTAISALARLRAIAMAHPKPRRDELSDDEKLILHIHLKMLQESLTTLGCVISNKGVEEIFTLMNMSTPAPMPIRHSYLIKQLAHIDKTMEHELATKFVVVLSPDTVQYFEQKEPHFGDEVLNKFPACSYEIEEAGKCLALGRTTAAVFHSMRILEIALKAIYQCLGLPQLTRHERSWGALLGRIKDNLATRGKTWAELPLFQVLYERLDAVKDAQRNNTMHVEDKCTLDEARLVFENTKQFMMKLASRMDQGGLPLA